MSYLLDTCVVTELRKESGVNAGLAKWAKETPGPFYISTLTLFELELSVQLAEKQDPSGGAALRAWLTTRVDQTFRGCILPFDEAAATACARLQAASRRPGREAMFAAVAISHRFTLITHDEDAYKGFEGLSLHNPWTAKKRS